MSATTGADLDGMAALVEQLSSTARRLDTGADGVGDALARVRATWGELRPALPDHAGATHDLADRVRRLADGVAGTAERLAAADRPAGPWWVPGFDQQGDFRGTGAAAADLWDDVLAASSATTAGTVAAGFSAQWYAEQRLATITARWGGRGFIPWGTYRATTGIGYTRTIRQMDAAKRAQEAANAAARARLAGTAARGEDLLDGARLVGRAGGPVAQTIQELAAARSASPLAATVRQASGIAGRASAVWRHPGVAGVRRVGGRALGAVGMATSAVGTITALQEGDHERAAVQGAYTLGGALMMTPVPGAQVAGAVITAGALVYEHREQIADAAGAVVDGVGSLAGGAKDLVGGAGKVLGGLF